LTISRRLSHDRPWLLLFLTIAVVQGCAQKPAPPPARQYAVDQTGGAKSCNVSKVTPADGKDTDVPMTVGNDGGWCAITVAQRSGAGLLTSRPAHGKVFVHQVGDDTRIDYTPAAGYAGQDNFAVTLVPGDAVLRTDVTVVK
jgi:hypothetical protein